MRGFRNIYRHSHTFSFLLVFFVLILFFPAFSSTVNTLSATESLTISSNRTIVSPNDVFELGFFKPGTSSRWYLGIWYKTILQRTYVWVANRDKPLINPIGTLKISNTNLVLLDSSDTLVWSTNLTERDVISPVVAQLLDNGNFVLRYSNKDVQSEFLWQSFHFPTDTLLPQMKIGLDRKTEFNRFLRSWRSADDPASGDYSFKLKTRGVPEFFIWVKQNTRMYRSGPWNGIRFSGMPEMLEFDYMVYNFTENREEIVYTFLMTNHSIYSRLTMTPAGYLQQSTWFPTEEEASWVSPNEQCDTYRICGPYGYCDMITSPICNCIKGFTPRYSEAWKLKDGASGCVRKTPVSCNGKDEFVQLKNMKLPDTTSAVVDKRIGLNECRERCLNDCNCTAFANINIQNRGSGCVVWTRELLDIRNYPAAGQDLYVKIAAADYGDERNQRGKIIGLTVGVSLMVLLSFIIFCLWKRKQMLARATATPTVLQERNQDLLMIGVVISSRRHLSEENITEDLELPSMELKAVVMATENFSDCNKLGQGGFGIVYKGRLLDGQEIAVKRLSETSDQGVHEFKNELRLIARLQHINLVRLLGCCVDEGEKMLIYEYMENLSLDSHLFDKTRSCKLNWQMRFDITTGIARGILYLHQDSRCRIIHRDLKASNVLLDKDMTPKISDFGMARIFGREETEANTRKVVGTYGYMSPEYAMDGIFSMKSDVFSFGVLLLEIISGKRNKGFYNSNGDLNLLGFVWRNWKEGKWTEIIDPAIIDSSSSSLSDFQPQEVLRCIQVGLLCVQERAEERPTMSSVVVMLGSETAAIPHPKPPGYCVGRNLLETVSSSSDESCTVNQITISIMDAR
uniref:Receptor-like serine/threonine-protein kinase n=1 Tax=Arabidopsis halleri TaxID=81970 RepID=A0A0C5JYN3_ARAHA|nr:SRKp [Arabidopsis halleri]